MRKSLAISFFFLLLFFIYKNFFNLDKILGKLEKKVHKIVIHNLDNLDEDLILRKIKLKEDQSFWNFNSTELSNDLKKIRGINNFPTASILVFNIQGQVIFQHSNINGDYQPWNGTYLNGQLLLAADYYYQIILDTDNPTQSNTLTGSIMITY